VVLVVVRRWDDALRFQSKGDPLMSRARLLLLSLAAVLAVAGVSASTASAKISFEWFVGGNLLKEKETREFDVNNDGKTFDFHSKLLGINILLLSNSISVKKGAIIIGGKPGTNEETVVFNGVTVDPPLSKCVAETGGISNPTPGVIETKPLKTEIVEGENGEVLILFTPKEGTTFVEILFLNKSATEECAANGAKAPVTGSILGLPLPQRVEVLRQNLVFEAAEHNFFLSSGALNTAGLVFGTEPATLSGLTLILLTNDAVFDPF
jgi:hypothetical protein